MSLAALLHVPLLRERLEADAEFIAELAGMLLADAPMFASVYERALWRSAADEACVSAHTLKGAAANLCAERLSAAAALVEQYLLAGDLPGARAARGGSSMAERSPSSRPSASARPCA